MNLAVAEAFKPQYANNQSRDFNDSDTITTGHYWCWPCFHSGLVGGEHDSFNMV